MDRHDDAPAGQLPDQRLTHGGIPRGPLDSHSLRLRASTLGPRAKECRSKIRRKNFSYRSNKGRPVIASALPHLDHLNFASVKAPLLRGSPIARLLWHHGACQLPPVACCATLLCTLAADFRHPGTGDVLQSRGCLLMHTDMLRKEPPSAIRRFAHRAVRLAPGCSTRPFPFRRRTQTSRCPTRAPAVLRTTPRTSTPAT